MYLKKTLAYQWLSNHASVNEYSLNEQEIVLSQAETTQQSMDLQKGASFVDLSKCDNFSSFAINNIVLCCSQFYQLSLQGVNA